MKHESRSFQLSNKLMTCKWYIFFKQNELNAWDSWIHDCCHLLQNITVPCVLFPPSVSLKRIVSLVMCVSVYQPFILPEPSAICVHIYNFLWLQWFLKETVSLTALFYPIIPCCLLINNCFSLKSCFCYKQGMMADYFVGILYRWCFGIFSILASLLRLYLYDVSLSGLMYTCWTYSLPCTPCSPSKCPQTNVISWDCV